MKFLATTKFLATIKNGLRFDLVYSFVWDDDKWLICISTHKSDKVMFKSGKEVMTCVIDESEYNTNYKTVADAIINIYKPLLISRDVEIKGETDEIVSAS